MKVGAGPMLCCMLMYTAMVVGVVLIIGLGVPAIMWLTKLIKPPKPKEEAIHRGVEEARRRIDRFPH
jgi:hypothetical protein